MFPFPFPNAAQRVEKREEEGERTRTVLLNFNETVPNAQHAGMYKTLATTYSPLWVVLCQMNI